MKKDRKNLREGFTTGSAATAASAACIEALAGEPPRFVTIDLPIGRSLTLPLHTFESRNGHLIATIQKDGGDDPDITDKAIVGAIVTPVRHVPPDSRIVLRGGRGVGQVTRPGLPVKVGEAAINPVPRAMIRQEVTRRLPGDVTGVEVEIFIEDGERLAEKTLNLRLGIVGGLSVLGTTGIVKPFSAESYRETINLCLQGARQNGLDTAVLSTGGKSERLIQAELPELPELSFVQIADFLKYALDRARDLMFRRVVLSCFFGKLCKWALGGEYTHAHTQRMDFNRLSTLAAAADFSETFCRFVKRANTARQIAESGFPEAIPFIHQVGDQAYQFITHLCGQAMEIIIYCWQFDGNSFFRWPL